MMIAYLYLGIAIVAEVIATTALRAAEGFTQLWPSAISVAGYVVAFYFLSLDAQDHAGRHRLRHLVGRRHRADLARRLADLHSSCSTLPAILGMALIMAGVIVINLFSKTAVH